ncbi:hypothetical protein ACWGJ9_12000 [Curtobacterium citreum]
MTDYLPGTVAARTDAEGLEVLLRCEDIDAGGGETFRGWVSSRDEEGTFPVSNERLGDLLLWEQDRAATIVLVNDAGTTRTDFPAFPNTRSIADQYDDEDEGDAAVDLTIKARLAAFRDAVHTDHIGTVLVVIDQETGTTVGAGRYTEQGWVTTMNSYSDLTENSAGLTVVLAPAECDESIA